MKTYSYKITQTRYLSVLKTDGWMDRAEGSLYLYSPLGDADVNVRLYR
jgi:hypothetical protein